MPRPERTRPPTPTPERTPEAAPELPGGGETVFPNRRLVAAYGSPDAPGLGILGEGTIDDAVDQVHQYAQDLPQKVLMLHQFKPQMITNREDINTSYQELAMVLHVDGHGPPEIKMDSWQIQREDLSEDFWMGWKNFYDEDFPTFTPQQTYGIDPQPWFISYQ